MKEKIKELIDLGNWEEANRFVNEHRAEFSDEDLHELEQDYRNKLGAKELDEKELERIGGGTALSGGFSTAPKAGNINYHCNDVSVHRDCHDSVSISSSCWFDDACFLVLHHYGDDGWIGGIYNDMEK